jgi:hypothetical protein
MTHSVHVKPVLFDVETIKVSMEGDLVATTIGNSTFKVHYSAALQIAQWLRIRAKESQRFVQDKNRHWSTLNDFDPELTTKPVDKPVPTYLNQIQLVNRPPSLVMSQQVVEVKSENDLVVFSIGNTDLKFHYEQAFKISKLMREVAKTTKRVNGDSSRTMSCIGSLHNATPD